MKLKQRSTRNAPFPLTRGDYPLVTHNRHKASTITSTQQQKQKTVQVDNLYLHNTAVVDHRSFFFCLPSVAVSSRNRCIPPRSRRSLSGQRRPPQNDWIRTCAENRLSVLQVTRLSFSRRPRRALIRFQFSGVLRQSLWRRIAGNP